MPELRLALTRGRGGAALVSGQSEPRMAVVPSGDEGLNAAIESAGGRIVEAGAAQGIVWTEPGDPQGLIDLLSESPATWVQLPFAGIESFVAAGAVDDSHTFACAKGAYGHATAEHALTLLLAGARRLDVHVRAKSWERGDLGHPERRIAGTTVVIVGTGGIGSELAAMLVPLRARTIGVNRSGKALEGAERTEPAARLDELLPGADFVVVAAAHTRATHHLFAAEQFARMKEDAWLVNVARGGLVDTNALVAALQSGAIGGAALDVTDPEPLPDRHPLWDIPNVIITPHVANTWNMGLAELRQLVARNVTHFAHGEQLEGVVDVRLGY